jgi:hypothetical protein
MALACPIACRRPAAFRLRGQAHQRERACLIRATQRAHHVKPYVERYRDAPYGPRSIGKVSRHVRSTGMCFYTYLSTLRKPCQACFACIRGLERTQGSDVPNDHAASWCVVPVVVRRGAVAGFIAVRAFCRRFTGRLRTSGWRPLMQKSEEGGASLSLAICISAEYGNLHWWHARFVGWNSAVSRQAVRCSRSSSGPHGAGRASDVADRRAAAGRSAQGCMKRHPSRLPWHAQSLSL